MDPRPIADARQVVVSPSPHVLHGRIVERVGQEERRVLVDGDHGSHLQVGGSHGHPIDQQATEAVAICGHHEPTVFERVGCARHELDPTVVVVGEDRRGIAGRGIGFQHLQAALVARLDSQQQPFGRRPVHGREVRVLVAIPFDLDRPAVERQDVQFDDGVRCARRRIADLARLLVGCARLGDVPTLDGRHIDAAGRDRRTIGAPPVPAIAMQFLAGDVVGRSPRHLGVLVAGQFPAAAVQLGDSQRAAADVGQPARCGVGAGIEDGPVDHQFAGDTTDQAGDEQPPGEWKRHDGDGTVGRERGDPGGRLAHSFAPRALFCGQVIGIELCQQRHRVGDQPLLAAGDVEHVQAVDRIVTGPAADEHDPPAIGRHDEVARLAERQPPSAGELPREGVWWRRGNGVAGFECHGVTMILACSSGLARSRNAWGMPSIPTDAVTQGARSTLPSAIEVKAELNSPGS